MCETENGAPRGARTMSGRGWGGGARLRHVPSLAPLLTAKAYTTALRRGLYTFIATLGLSRRDRIARAGALGGAAGRWRPTGGDWSPLGPPRRAASTRAAAQRPLPPRALTAPSPRLPIQSSSVTAHAQLPSYALRNQPRRIFGHWNSN